MPIPKPISTFRVLVTAAPFLSDPYGLRHNIIRFRGPWQDAPEQSSHLFMWVEAGRAVGSPARRASAARWPANSLANRGRRDYLRGERPARPPRWRHP